MRFTEFYHNNAVTDEQQQQPEPTKFDWWGELDLDDFIYEIGRESFGECPVGITVDTKHSWDGEETRNRYGLVVVEIDQIWASVLSDPEDTEGRGASHWINITDDVPEDLAEELLRQYCDDMERRDRTVKYMTAWEYDNES